MPTIDAIELYRVRMPLVYPFRTAYGSDDAVESMLVKMISGDTCGWGESQPFMAPTYSPEFSAGIFLVSKMYFAPQLVGHKIDSGDTLQERLACFKGNPFAKAGLDMAWWDLHAKLRGEPLYKTLGGKKPTVEVGADFGAMETVDALLAKIDEAVKAGYKRVKLKYAPGWELNMLEPVRRTFPKMTFHIDCNSGYRLRDREMFLKIDKLNLAMIEQPLAHDDLVDHAMLQVALQTPICLDESINSVENARKAMEIGACKWINIKPVRVGGHTPALAIHDMAERAKVPCWVGGMLESAIGAAHCLAMATKSNIRYPSDVFPSNRFFDRDLGLPETQLSGPSQIIAQPGPGIGVEPDPEQLERLTVEQTLIEPGG